MAQLAGQGGGVRPASDRATDAATGLAGAAQTAKDARRDRPAVASAVSPNVLNRQFDALAQNRKWVANFTYLWTAEGWLYVAAIVDLFSRRVVGWSMQATMTAQLVTDALVMAIWRRGKPETVLHHSDRGSQYTSEPFQRLLTDCKLPRQGDTVNSALASVDVGPVLRRFLTRVDDFFDDRLVLTLCNKLTWGQVAE